MKKKKPTRRIHKAKGVITMSRKKDEEGTSVAQVPGHPETSHGKDDDTKGEEVASGESKPGHPEVEH